MQNQIGATQKLAHFTAGITYDKLSDTSRTMAKKCILDWLGVAIRGSQEKPAQILRGVVTADAGASNQATVLDGHQWHKSTVLNAAMCNGAASHTLDFDDLHNPSIIHLATVVVPPAMALAQANHKSGRELIAAVCAGYEAGARVGEAVIPESYFYWHTTGTAGTFGAAAAAANILSLSPEETLMCYGSAGSQAAGLWEFLKEGAMSKALHAGKASYAGVLAALLSKAGFTGASTILEGEKGFCHAMVREPHLEKLTEGLGSGKLKIDENSFKPYACCKHSHAALYAIQRLRGEHKLHADNINSIDILVNDITDYLINNPAPQNAYGCKFSIQYCAAAMLQYGQVGIDQFTDAAINDPATRSLMNKITVTRDPKMEAIHKADASRLASAVNITCADGKQLTMQVDYPKGDPECPMTWEDLAAKFISLTSPVCGAKMAAKLCSMIENLEKQNDVDAALLSCLKED